MHVTHPGASANAATAAAVHTGAANAAATADGNAASAAAASLACRLLLLLLLLGVCAPVQCCLINASHLVVHKQAGQQHRQAEDLRTVLGRLQDTQAVCYQSLSVPTSGASARVTPNSLNATSQPFRFTAAGRLIVQSTPYASTRQPSSDSC